MRKRSVIATISALAMAVVSTMVFLPATAGAQPSPPAAENFGTSSMTVFAGSQVSLHWSTETDDLFLLTSVKPDSLPNFSSRSVVQWPSGSNATWNSTWGWWQTSNSETVTLTIPANAAAGTQYAFQLYTCASQTDLCSNSSGSSGPGDSEVTMRVAGSNWSQVPYTNDFKYLVKNTQTSGGPTDLTFSSTNTLWLDSEFFDGLGESAYVKPSQPVSTATMATINDPYNVDNKPFVNCLVTPCGTTDWSGLGESLTYVDKLVWSTEGGWYLYSGSLANPSEVLAYDPTSGGFCTYLVPGDDQEIFGITSTGSGKTTTIWFDAQDPTGGNAELDSFEPSAVGDRCPGTYKLSGATTSFKQFALPNNWPTEIGANPSGTEIWVGDDFGNAIESVNTTTGAVATYSYTPTNAYNTFASPNNPVAYSWQVVADASYVYAVDFGDSNLVRIETAGPNAGEIDEVPLPLNSDLERGFGLALDGSTLYFTTTNGGTLGSINIGAWEAASSVCSLGDDCAPVPADAVEYTGIEEQTDPSTDGYSPTGNASYGGVAVAKSGQIAVADYFSKQTIRLVP